MNLYTYNFEGVTYEFRLSNKAKVEIERQQLKAMSEMNDPQLIKAISSIEKMQNELAEDMTDDEREIKAADLMAEMLPVMGKVQKLNSTGADDIVELGYILLHSLSKYKDLTHDKYDEMVEDMEEKLGFKETQSIFKDISDKVFTLIAEVKGEETSKKKEAKKKTKKKTEMS